MDSWSEKQLNSMKAGGNANMKSFYRSQGVNDEEFRRLSIKERYDSVTAAIYREKLKATVEGRAFDLAKARSQAAAEYAALPAPRHAQSMPQLPSVSAARSSAALPTTPAASPASSSMPRQQKKNEWEDDWDALLNDKAAQSTSTPEPALNRSGSVPRIGDKSASSLASSSGAVPPPRRPPDARSADMFSPGALQDTPSYRGGGGGGDDEAEERLRRLGMADAPRGHTPTRDWRDSMPPESAAGAGGGAAGGGDYYGMLAQGWNQLASTAVTYSTAAAKIAQDRLSTIDTSAVKGSVAPVVASVSSYIGSWWNGEGQPPQGYAAGQQQYGSGGAGGGPSGGMSSGGGGGGGGAEARKDDSYDWSKWGWGAEAKEKGEEAPAAAKSSNGDDGWGEWGAEEQGTAKPRRAVTGKRD